MTVCRAALPANAVLEQHVVPRNSLFFDVVDAKVDEQKAASPAAGLRVPSGAPCDATETATAASRCRVAWCSKRSG